MVEAMLPHLTPAQRAQRVGATRQAHAQRLQRIRQNPASALPQTDGQAPPRGTPIGSSLDRAGRVVTNDFREHLTRVSGIDSDVDIEDYFILLNFLQRHRWSHSDPIGIALSELQCVLNDQQLRSDLRFKPDGELVASATERCRKIAETLAVSLHEDELAHWKAQVKRAEAACDAGFGIKSEKPGQSTLYLYQDGDTDELLEVAWDASRVRHHRKFAPAPDPYADAVDGYCQAIHALVQARLKDVDTRQAAIDRKYLLGWHTPPGCEKVRDSACMLLSTPAVLACAAIHATGAFPRQLRRNLHIRMDRFLHSILEAERMAGVPSRPDRQSVQNSRNNQQHILQPKPIKFKPKPLETSASIREAFISEWGSACWYCGVDRGGETGALQLDHVAPNQRDGSNHDCWNRALACIDCNLAKSNRLTPKETIDRAFMDGRISTKSQRDEQYRLFNERRDWTRRRWERLQRNAGIHRDTCANGVNSF